jgi:autotransporter-associated beta strand protein
MRHNRSAKLAAVAAAFSSGILAFAHHASAQVDFWQATNGAGNASGSWGTAGNWSLGIPTNVETADFTQQDITSTSTITLDANHTIGAINFGDSNTATSAGWVLNSSTTQTNNNTNILTLNAPGYNIVTVNQLGAGSVATINADMSNGSGGGLELAKGGAGTLVLTGNNSTLTGTTAINNGVLELDFNHAWSPLTNILGDSGTAGTAAQHVNFQGGTLLLNGGAGLTNSQAFSSGTALENGGSQINFNQNGATSLSLNMGPLTRNLYATIDVALPTTGTVTVAAGTGGQAYPSAGLGTNNSGLGGLLVDTNGTPFATVNNGADWAIVNGSNQIVPASTNGSFYTASTASTLSGNADVVTNTTLSAGTSVNTIRFNAAGPYTVDLGGASNTLTTHGILVTANTGAVTIQNGNLVTGETGNGDTTISQNSSSTMTVSAVIAGATAITKMGTGALTLTASNTYTGETVINAGTVNVPTGGTIGTFFTFGNPLNADIQIAPAYGDSGTLNVSGGTVNAARTIIAGNDNNFAGGTGVLNQTGGTINSSQWFTVGGFGNGTFNMSGGTLNTNAATGTVLEVGVFGSSNGVVNMSGTAQINVNNNGSIVLGSVNTNGSGTFNQEAGTITFHSDNGTTVGGTGSVILGTAGAPGLFTYNLDGGTLTTPGVTHQNGSAAGTAIMNFNGGTLVATGNSTAYIGSLTQANVKAGGAIINTNGFNDTVPQVLQHSATLGATPDGGLVKNGAGTLVLSGLNTYTGATVINAGTLQLPSTVAPTPVAAYSFDTGYSNGVLNPGAVVTNSGSGGSALNGSVNITDWQLAGTGPASGATIVSGGPYANGHSLNFDGAGTSVDIPSQIIDQNGGGSWTLSAWVQSNLPGSTILSKNTGADTWGPNNSVYYIGSNSGGGATNVWNNNGYPTGVRFGTGFIQGTPNSGTASDGNWHMITYTDNGGTQSIYMDGQPLVLNVTGAGGADVSNLTRLGFNVDTFFAGDGNTQFLGNMDDLNFYNVGLTAQQIQQLFLNNTVSVGSGGGQFLPATTAVSMPTSGAALNLNSQNQTIGSLSGVAGTTVLLGGANLTTGGNNTSTAFAGSISGVGKLIKTGSGVFTITGSNNYGGGTTVQAGTLVVGAAGAMPSGSVSITGGDLLLGTSTGLATITSLAISGSGTFDVNNNHVIINYGGGSDPIASIQALLNTGYNGGAWNGLGGITSSAVATNPGYGVGYADAADPGNPAGLSSGQIEVAFTLLGDANLDKAVNGVDFGILAANFNKGVTGWDKGDFNYDNAVNGVDFGFLAANFNKGAASASDIAALDAFAAANGLLADVPEPASIGLVLLGATSLLARRRRQSV